MRRLSPYKLTFLAWLLAATLLLGGCLASDGTATLIPTPRPLTLTSTSVPATATATATVVPTPTPGMPADFAFFYKHDFCGDVIDLDTFTGTYYAQIRDGLESGKVNLVFTPAELLVFYREIVALDPFNLSGEITPSAGRFPQIEFRFYVRMEGRTQGFSWSGHSQSGTPTTADIALRRFAITMSRLVSDRPELRELRRRGVGCT